MNYLFHSSLSLSTPTRAIMYDEALKLSEEGHRVTLLYCAGLMSQCFINICGNSARCSLCNSYYRSDKRRFGKNLRFIPMSSIVSDEQKSKVAALTFEYKNIEEIKALTYEGLNIGIGTLSAYITCSRNMNPLLDEEFRRFFDETLRNAVLNIISLKYAVSNFDPDHIVLYNGRFADSRPVWEFAEQSNIPFTTLESIYGINKNFKARYENGTPFSLIKNKELMEQLWSDPVIDEKYKEDIGASFFERRRNALYTGDKIYTATQQDGLMPDNWDKTKHNIVIFNSSEDEFAAVGGELEEKAIFKSQLLGIQYIKNLFKENDQVHITLRIHPNLSQVEYSYAKDLIKLDGKGFDVIEGVSPISTYSLIDAADVVVVFGSTVGAEATYWRKPVILLAGAVYFYLDCCYTPRNVEEMVPLLTAKLEPKSRESALKFGYFLMTEHWDEPDILDFDWSYKDIKFLGLSKKIEINNWQKTLGSRNLYALIRSARWFLQLQFSKLLPRRGDKLVLPLKEAPNNR